MECLMAKPDDLDAVRKIAAALSGFSPEEQDRILRWVREKIGLAPTARTVPETRTSQPSFPAATTRPPEVPDLRQAPTLGKDLKTFVLGKNPRSDVQFSATVAYFHRFEAPPDQRRNEIDAAVLQDACRLAGRARLTNPLKTLNNAKSLGVLDSGTEKGKFTINTVGENLVAMTLPGHADGSARGNKPKRPKKSAKKAVGKN